MYYFGARYYDPRTSVWQSADPILEKFLPNAPHNEDEVVQLLPPTSQQSLILFNLPGMGGVFNSSNMEMYGYGHQNPTRFIDPDGNASEDVVLPANRNSPGTVTVKNDFGRVLGEFPVLGKGRENGQNVQSGDTPTGTYNIGAIVPSRTADDRKHYGPSRTRLQPLSGNALTSRRSGIDLHGGGSSNLPGRKGLKGTLGCLRVSNENDVKISALIQGARDDRSSIAYKVEGFINGLFGNKADTSDKLTVKEQN